MKASTVPGNKQPAKAPTPAGGLTEKPGLVEKNSKTLTALNNQLPISYKSIRIIPGTSTIYVEGDANKATISASSIRAEKQYLQKQVKAEMQAADQSWDSWMPVK